MTIPINPAVAQRLPWFLGGICQMLRLESAVWVLEKFMRGSCTLHCYCLTWASALAFFAFCACVVFGSKHCCALTGSVVTWLDRSRYSLLYSTSYRQRSGAGLINTVQGHVWQVIVIAVTLDLPWRQAVVVCVCCEDTTQMQHSVSFVVFFVKSCWNHKVHSFQAVKHCEFGVSCAK